ncbi:hypothetical protein [Mesorhizobium sp.]|uniref:hypothetical protein n=1 Tax=Mesorhizobium sp. TaxID=1871066 RepID=UPI0025BD0110|nr:hypothetical protein [Mesorhizobium sp.]
MTNRMHNTLCAIMVASAGIGSVLLGSMVARAIGQDVELPAYELQATTRDGNLYVAGSGDSCAAAIDGANCPSTSPRWIACASVSSTIWKEDQPK